MSVRQEPEKKTAKNAVEFVTLDRDTPYLLPPSIQDYLPEDHLARFVVEMVDSLDMRRMLGVYAGKGKKPYHPAMLVALLFYCYATGTFSSRKLEKATYDSIAYRYICANTHPDHDTIASFRKRFLEELEGFLVRCAISCAPIANEFVFASYHVILRKGIRMSRSGTSPSQRRSAENP